MTAAELRALAKQLDARGHARNQVGGDATECEHDEDVDCHTVAAVSTWYRAASILERRADELDQQQQDVEWGIRHEDSGRIERCSEHGAHVLAAPGVTPVRRVVGAWQDTTPNPPAQISKEN